MPPRIRSCSAVAGAPDRRRRCPAPPSPPPRGQRVRRAARRSAAAARRHRPPRRESASAVPRRTASSRRSGRPVTGGPVVRRAVRWKRHKAFQLGRRHRLPPAPARPLFRGSTPREQVWQRGRHRIPRATDAADSAPSEPSAVTNCSVQVV